MKKEWEIKSLEELENEKIITLGRGVVISRKDLLFTPGNYPVYSSAQLNNGVFGVYGKYMFDEELITWSVDGGGSLFYRPKHKFSITNVGGYCRILKTDIISYKYLYFVLMYLHSTVKFDWVKKAHPSVLRKEYKTIPIPTLSEQKEIVSLLEKMFNEIAKAKENANKNLENTKDLFESYMQNVFTGNDWEQKTLGEIATFRNGMNFTKSSKGEKINIVGVKDFKNNFWVPLKNLDSVTLDGKLNDSDLLNKGDILVVRSNGNPQLIGRSLLASDVVGKVSHSGFTIRIRLDTEIIDPIYLCHYLKGPKTRKILIDRGNGVGIKSLNQTSLSTLVIPFPKSIKTQSEIVKKINALSDKTIKLEKVYQQKINDLEELKKSILQKAFSGELKNVKV